MEVGNVYEIEIYDPEGVFTNQRIANAKVDFVCASKDDSTFHFHPIDYYGEVPGGKTQGTQTYVIGISEVSRFRFIEQPETTKKFQAGVLSSKR